MATYKFVVFRLVNRLVTLLFLAIVSFFLFEVIPQLLGFNVAFLFAGITQLSPKQAQAQLLLVDTIAKAYGLYDPLPLRIYHFLFNMFTFNFGYSPTFKEPVLKVVSQYLPNSLILSGVSLITTSVLSIVFGVYAAKSFINSKRKIGDKTVSIFSIGTYFLPVIWIGPILYFVLADQARIFPINLAFALNCGGVCHPTGLEYYLRYLWAATLPIIVLTILGFGHRQQLLRNNIIEEYNSSSYAIYARARGIPSRQIFYKHAFRNALLPWVTQVGLDVAFLIYGLFFVEVIFQFPGIGYASVLAATTLDIPFLISTTFLFGLYTLLVLFVLDFVYAMLDPRIRLGE